MPNLEIALQQLREERKQAQLAGISFLTPGTAVIVPPNPCLRQCETIFIRIAPCGTRFRTSTAEIAHLRPTFATPLFTPPGCRRIPLLT